MKSNYSKVFLSPIVLMVLITFGSSSLFGQEGDYFYEDDTQEDAVGDPSVVSPDEHYVIKRKDNDKDDNVTSDKKNTTIRKATPAAKAQKTEKKPELDEMNHTLSNQEGTESPLSFNFLYYIIQKFKFSDIVDE